MANNTWGIHILGSTQEPEAMTTLKQLTKSFVTSLRQVGFDVDCVDVSIHNTESVFNRFSQPDRGDQPESKE